MIRASPALVVLAFLAVVIAPGAAHVPTAVETPTVVAADSAAEGSAAASSTVTVADFEFVDSGTGTPVTAISPGDSVTWVWVSGTHSVTHGVDVSVDPLIGSPVAGDFDSGIRQPPAAPYTVSFPAEGVYAYYCLTHVGMRGTVIVA